MNEKQSAAEVGGAVKTESLRQQFVDDGFIVVRNLLTAPEVAQYRAELQRLSGQTDADFDAKRARIKGWTKPDGVTVTPSMWPLIFNERLVSTARGILGADARYTQHSDLHVHHGTVGWHRDSRDRQFGVGGDWDESKAPYRIARVAIYLQPFAESGSALGLLPGSHRRESRLNRLEQRVNRFLVGALQRPDFLLPLLTRSAVWIKTEPGDAVLFDQRCLHTGTHVFGPKYAIFLSFGADNLHSRNHRRYYMENRSDLGYRDYPDALVPKLQEHHLHLGL